MWNILTKPSGYLSYMFMILWIKFTKKMILWISGVSDNGL